jgi:hypothetical protein
MMPGTPKLSTKVDHVPVGEIVENLYTYESKKITLTAEYSDLPEIAVAFGGKKTIYDKSKKGFLKDVGGEELVFEDITVGGHKGKELAYKTATRSGKVRFILMSKRLYVLQASVLLSSKDKSPIDYYLKSFKATSG